MRRLFTLSLIILVTALFSSCNKDKSLNIDKIDGKINANFSADKQRVFIGNSVAFKCESVNATTYEWIFEGGEPSTSTDAHPIVTYPKKGKYKVTLKVSNGELSNIKEIESFITVYETAGWENFTYPEIHFSNKTIGANGALYAKLIPNEKEFIKKVCLEVCQELFKSAEEVNTITDITYTVKDDETISAKGGNPPHINIAFSSSYLMQKKREGLSDAELIKEIEGVLVHELTHGYQYSPQGAGDYSHGTDFFSFVEGVADEVRYLKGFTKLSQRQVGGNWKDGYNTSAFFIEWLHSKDINFLYKFNQTVNRFNPWSWTLAVRYILGNNVVVSDLWNEYQSDLASGKIIQIDAKLKELRKSGNTDVVPTDKIDITNSACVISFDSSKASPDSESVFKLIDNNPSSKFLIFSPSTWVKIESKNTSVISSYTLVSGGDAEERDPKKWTLSASVDGKTWEVIDSRDNEKFSSRNEKREYTFENKKAYKSYKFSFNNTSGEIFQLSEIELLGAITEVSSLLDITKQNPTFKAGHEDVSGGWGLPSFSYDGDCGTPCFAATNASFLSFETANKYNVSEFVITNSGVFNSVRYDLSSCKLLASNNGTDWVDLSEDLKVDFVNEKDRKSFMIDNKAFYKYHKLEYSNVKHDEGYLMIGDLEIYGQVQK